MSRTFTPMSLADAANELQDMERGYATNMPEITEFHILTPVPGGVLVCIHDTANDDSFQSLLTEEATNALSEGCDDAEEFGERALAHLTRVARAVFN